MFKPLKSSSIILVAAMLTFTLSFSVLQACVVFSGKPFDEQCKGKCCESVKVRGEKWRTKSGKFYFLVFYFCLSFRFVWLWLFMGD